MFAITHPQKRIVINQQIFPDSKFAHMYGRVEIKNRDAESLVSAINAAIEFFDCLRIRFVKADSEILQKIIPYNFTGIATQPWDFNLTDEQLSLFDSDLYRFNIAEKDGIPSGYFFVFHHAIVDAYTITLIIRFIEDFLAAKPLHIQPTFRAFVKEEQVYIKSEAFKKDYAFFEAQLANATCYKYVPDFDLRSNRIENTFSDEQSAAMLSFCKRHNVSVFKLIYAALFLLLYSKDGKVQQTISTTHHNRNTAELLQTGGMLTSTLPIVYKIDTSLSFVDFLKQVSAHIDQSLKRHAFPIDLLLTEKDEIFDLDITSIMLNSIPFGKEGGSVVTRFSPKGDVALLNFKLNPHSKPKGANIEIAVDYRINKYTQNQVKTLLERLAQIALLFMENESAIIANAITPPKDVLDLISKSIKENPQRLALADYNTVLTYKQLDEYSNAVACHLSGSEQVIGVQNERSVWYIVAVLGVLKAGRAFVVLDMELPTHRLDDIISQTGIKTILTRECIGKLTPVSERTHLQIGSLAYILFTSGSSGVPKGVLVSRSGLLPLVRALISRMDIQNRQHFLAYCDFSFDVSIAEIFLSICTGSTLFIADDTQRENLKELDAFIRFNKIDYAFLPTPAGELFIQYFPKSPLKCLVIAGEKMTYYKPTEYTVFNGYGPTEFTCLSHMEQIDRKANRYSIGSPLDGVVEQIVDEYGHSAQIGELILKGKQAAIGYLHDYGLTSRRFIRDSFKTGDKVERGMDGKLYFLYRLDRQIKHKGYRIELGEIEIAAMDTGLVRKAICSYSEKRICLELYAKADDNIATKMRSLLAEKLPHYALPHQILIVDDFKKTKSGKTALDSLRYESAATSTELKLIKFFAKYVNNAKAHSNLLHSGIDSLDIINIILDMELKFGWTIQFSDFFTYPTIRQLAAYFDSLPTKDNCDCTLVKLRDGSGSPLVLIFDMSRDIIAYNPLLTALRHGYPIYGIIAKTIPADTTFENFVNSLSVMLSFDICDLVGYSSGGTIAVALAKKLEHRVGRVFLIDSPNYNLYPQRMNFHFILKNLWLVLTAYGIKGVFAYGCKSLRELWKSNAVVEGKKLIKLIQGYKPEKPLAHLTLFASSETKTATDTTLGWEGIINDNDIISLKGRHISVLKVCADEVARTIDSIREGGE